MYSRFFKRPLDIAGALTAFLLLGWLGLAVALLVRWNLGSPVLFCQMRPGKEGLLFRLYKFRTMTDERGSDGTLLPDAQRLTPFGRFLRSTSLDELPQFLNILCGDMSLIGPRPLLPEYLPLYSERQRRRHEVRPGLSGLAQVCGRNALSWEERLELDVRYAESITFMGDMKLILRTLNMVLRREGVSAAGSATMPLFAGRTSGMEQGR
ncbi:sugar transferase [Mailhella sp.]|uniref:sugar transferase n=1 Tax=Mailhella sp. TaxID=1981029 RepID=UPI004063F505